MEYITYLLLFVGILLVAGGIFLTGGEKKNQAPQISANEFLHTSEKISEPTQPTQADLLRENMQRIEAKLEKLGLQNTLEPSLATPAISAIASTEKSVEAPQAFNSVLPSPLENIATHGKAQMAQQQHTEASPHAMKMPHISPVYVSQETPKLYSRECVLYIDSGNANSYTGHESSFDIRDVVGIKRFGKGKLSYDGYNFAFVHQHGEEKFPLNKVDHIAFYPNCVVLASKFQIPSAIFFLDETSTLRDILKTFQLS